MTLWYNHKSNCKIMKSLLYILLVNILVLVQSCVDTSCPPDKKIGEISLTEKSLQYFPYRDKSELIFEDNEGKELKFSSEKGVVTEKQKLAVKDICSELKYDGKTSFEYFEGQYKSILFFSKPEGFSFTLSLFTDVLDKEKQLFYDKMIINLSSSGYVGRGEMVTDYRSHESLKNNVIIDHPLHHIDSIVLNGKTYRDIYSTELFDGEQFNRQVYFNKEKGLVGFIVESKTYNLIH